MDKRLRPGREQDAATQAGTTRRKGIPGKRTRAQGLPRRAQVPVQRPQARSAAPDDHGGGALLTDEERGLQSSWSIRRPGVSCAA